LDPFDQQFEDGFNPLAFYFYNAPSRGRQGHYYHDYMESKPRGVDLLPLYWKYLESCESRIRPIGVVRVVHALGQMISLWPNEGLAALEHLVGRTEPMVRRAVVRVLAESHVRFPLETSAMLERAGSAFTENELFEIQCRRDRHLAERTLEQLQWARILHFLDCQHSPGDFIFKLVGILVNSHAVPEAFGRILTLILDRPRR